MRTALTPALVTLALAVACSTAPLSSSGDGGSDSDGGNVGTRDLGGAPPDLRGATCDDIAGQVKQWLDGHTGCTTDGDCQLLYTPCGLAGTCGAYVNRAASDPYLDGLEASWNADHCMGACPPCRRPGPPVCNAGVCGESASYGKLGDPCQENGECSTGLCLKDATQKGFVGGYCSLDCSGASGMCPAGSACKPAGGGLYCLKHCDTRLNTMQCRAGYACCSGPGPSGPDGWCAPTASSLCLAQ